MRYRIAANPRGAAEMKARTRARSFFPRLPETSVWVKESTPKVHRGECLHDVIGRKPTGQYHRHARLLDHVAADCPLMRQVFLRPGGRSSGNSHQTASSTKFLNKYEDWTGIRFDS